MSRVFSRFFTVTHPSNITVFSVSPNDENISLRCFAISNCSFRTSNSLSHSSEITANSIEIDSFSFSISSILDSDFFMTSSGFPDIPDRSNLSNSNFLRRLDILSSFAFRVMITSILNSLSVLSSYSTKISSGKFFIPNLNCSYESKDILPDTIDTYFESAKSPNSKLNFIKFWATLIAFVNLEFFASSSFIFSSNGLVLVSTRFKVSSAFSNSSSGFKFSTSFFSIRGGLTKLFARVKIPLSFMLTDSKKSAIPVVFIKMEEILPRKGVACEGFRICFHSASSCIRSDIS